MKVRPFATGAILLATGLLVGGFMLLRASPWAQRERVSESQVEQQTPAQPKGRDTEGPKPIHSTVYENRAYQFAFTYPTGWKIEEVEGPHGVLVDGSTDSSQVFRVTVRDATSPLEPAILTVVVYSNSSKLSVSDWWAGYLAQRDEAKGRCVAENPSAPCFSEHDQVQSQAATTFQGAAAERVLLFAFDHVTECLVLGHNQFMYHICWDAENPNDVEFGRHREASEAIRSSFHYTASENRLR